MTYGLLVAEHILDPSLAPSLSSSFAFPRNLALYLSLALLTSTTVATTTASLRRARDDAGGDGAPAKRETLMAPAAKRETLAAKRERNKGSSRADVVNVMVALRLKIFYAEFRRIAVGPTQIGCDERARKEETMEQGREVGRALP